jgi:hypothetical protein
MMGVQDRVQARARGFPRDERSEVAPPRRLVPTCRHLRGGSSGSRPRQEVHQGTSEATSLHHATRTGVPPPWRRRTGRGSSTRQLKKEGPFFSSATGTYGIWSRASATKPVRGARASYPALALGRLRKPPCSEDATAFASPRASLKTRRRSRRSCRYVASHRRVSPPWRLELVRSRHQEAARQLRQHHGRPEQVREVGPVVLLVSEVLALQAQLPVLVLVVHARVHQRV